MRLISNLYCRTFCSRAPMYKVARVELTVTTFENSRTTHAPFLSLLRYFRRGESYDNYLHRTINVTDVRVDRSR